MSDQTIQILLVLRPSTLLSDHLVRRLPILFIFVNAHEILGAILRLFNGPTIGTEGFPELKYLFSTNAADFTPFQHNITPTFFCSWPDLILERP